MDLDLKQIIEVFCIAGDCEQRMDQLRTDIRRQIGEAFFMISYE